VSITFESGSQLFGLAMGAFCGSGLRSIHLPASTRVIGNRCFCRCDSLASITFESGSQLSQLAKAAFFMSGLTSIHLPASVTVIGETCFSGCRSLASITFDSASAFRGSEPHLLAGLPLGEPDMEHDIVDNIDVNRAEYFDKRGRAKVRRPALKMHVTIHKDGKDVEVDAYVATDAWDIRADMLSQNKVSLNGLTTRDVMALYEYLPCRYFGGSKRVYFVSNSPNVANVIRRFLDAANDCNGEHFENGKEMKL
jgi:hypothetical protein